MGSSHLWNEKGIYEEALARYGESPKALHWTNYRAMGIRFKELVADLALDGKSILDVGCGMGDLLPFIYAKTTDFKYLGTDINQGFIGIAKKRYEGHEFKLLDPFSQKVPGRFDIVMSSGVMNVNIPDWLDRRKQMIARLFELAGEAASFNMAGSFKPPAHDEKIAYANSQEILDFCQTLSSRIVLRNHYSSIDFTISMFK